MAPKHSLKVPGIEDFCRQLILTNLEQGRISQLCISLYHIYNFSNVTLAYASNNNINGS